MRVHVCVKIRKDKKQKEAADMMVRSLLCQLHRWVTWLGMTLFLLTLVAVLCWALQDRPPVELKQYYTDCTTEQATSMAFSSVRSAKSHFWLFSSALTGWFYGHVNGQNQHFPANELTCHIYRFNPRKLKRMYDITIEFVLLSKSNEILVISVDVRQFDVDQQQNLKDRFDSLSAQKDSLSHTSLFFCLCGDFYNT